MRNIQRRGQTWQFRVGGPGEGKRLVYQLPVIVGALAAATALGFGFLPLRDLTGSAIVAGASLAVLAAGLVWAGLSVRNHWLEAGRFAPFIVQIDRQRRTIAAAARDGGGALWRAPFDASRLRIVPAAAGMPGVRLGGTTSALLYGTRIPDAAAFRQPHPDQTLLALASEQELRALVAALTL